MYPQQLPQIDPDLCLLAATTISQCQACVSSCPHRAWLISEESIALDTERCDSCGICLPACPTSAISIDDRTTPPLTLDRDTLDLSCRASESGRHANRIACIHGIGLEALAALYRSGLRTIYARLGTCATCPLADREGFWSRLLNWNSALQARGMPLIEVTYADDTCTAPPHESEETPDPGRRGFLTRLLGDRDQRATTANARDIDASPESPGQWLASSGIDGPLPYLPVIDPLLCTACHACAKICRQEAITHNPSDSCYRLRPERCNSCNLCLDICQADAVHLIYWQPPRQSRLALKSIPCEACGIGFSVIDQGDATITNRRCPICRNRNTMGNLFQVLN
ncbi:MAG: 4Fe-4S binding protein [Candidatus Sedimenticola endophacoides]